MLFHKWLSASAVAAIGIIGLGETNLQAVPRELTGSIGGSTVSSGWTWDTPDFSNVELKWVRTEGNNFFFEKEATFTRASDPIVITFNRIDPNAKTLVINDESVTNNTGVDWTAFRMELSSGSSGGTPNFTFVTSDGAPGIGDFAIDPYQTFTFYNNNSGILFGGGSPVKNGHTWFPGSMSDTGLALVASSSSVGTFTLKELPVTGSTVIPIPAAAWSGLSMLVGLGLIQGWRKLRATA
jgi:hypothetical protein